MSGTFKRTLFPKEFDSISYHKSEEYNNSSVQRVLLLPLTIEFKRDKVVDDITEAFLLNYKEMRNLTL